MIGELLFFHTCIHAAVCTLDCKQLCNFRNFGHYKISVNFIKQFKFPVSYNVKTNNLIHINLIAHI